MTFRKFCTFIQLGAIYYLPSLFLGTLHIQGWKWDIVKLYFLGGTRDNFAYVLFLQVATL